MIYTITNKPVIYKKNNKTDLFRTSKSLIRYNLIRLIHRLTPITPIIDSDLEEISNILVDK